MAVCAPSIHVFLGRPLFLLSHGIQSIINYGILSSGILLTWPYHCSHFCCMMSMMSGYRFTPIVSFICSFPKFLNYKVMDNLRVHNLPKMVLMKLLASPSVW